MVPHACYVGLVLMSLAMTLGACGTKETLDEAITCDGFRRQPDGSWSTTKNVSVDYDLDGTEHQTNYSNGVVIRAEDGEENARILAALEKKCAPK
jgi:hypothetical protein